MKTLCVAASLILTGCSGAQLTGGLGVRDTTYYDESLPQSVHLGRAVGELRIEQPIGENFYTACSHVSGINDEEGDGGLNYCSAGFRVDF